MQGSATVINFICGRPGGGKSLFAVMQLCEELRRSERTIVTNLALKLPELAEWCFRNIERPVDLSARVRLLDDDQVRQFYLYRPGMECTDRMVKGGMDVPDLTAFQSLPYGCLYVIDEAHLFFGAREWQRVGPDVQFFLSQHRKLGCDVMFITQHPEKCDKNFRRDAQDFTIVRNLGMERMFGGVSLHGRFRRATYLDIPRGNGTDTPTETGFFRLKVAEYGCLYDTSAGVGLVGRVDTHEVKKGRSPIWWAVGAVAILCCVAMIPKALGAFSSWVSGAFISSSSKIAQKVAGATGAATPSPAGQAPSPVTALSPGALSLSVPGRPGPGNREGGRDSLSGELELTGVVFFYRPDLCSWRLSDGRLITSRSPGFGGGGSDWVRVDGKRLQYVERPEAYYPGGPSRILGEGVQRVEPMMPPASSAPRRVRVSPPASPSPVQEVNLSSVPVPW